MINIINSVLSACIQTRAERERERGRDMHTCGNALSASHWQQCQLQSTKDCMRLVAVGPEDPRQLGLLQAAAMWAERPDPGIQGSSSHASATHYLHCSSETWPPLRKIIQLLPTSERMYLTYSMQIRLNSAIYA
jgi:hypothetical protein